MGDATHRSVVGLLLSMAAVLTLMPPPTMAFEPHGETSHWQKCDAYIRLFYDRNPSWADYETAMNTCLLKPGTSL